MMSSRASFLSLAAVGLASVLYVSHVARRRKKNEQDPCTKTTTEREGQNSNVDVGGSGGDVSSFEGAGRRLLDGNNITIAFSSTTGTCKQLAEDLFDRLSKVSVIKNSATIHLQILPINEIDFWDEFLNREEEEVASKPVFIFFIPTWTNGVAPPTASNLFSALAEIETDWRIESRPLKNSGLHVAAFGMGSTEYDTSTFCKPVKDAMKSLVKLGANKLKRCGTGMGDDAVGDYKVDVYRGWLERCVASIETLYACEEKKTSTTCCSQEEKKSHNDCACVSDENLDENDNEKIDLEDDEESIYNSDEDVEEIDDEDGDEKIIDLEDIGAAMKQSKSTSSKEPKEMVTPKQAIALKKEGYKLIGTHSAVKLCRWTKHQLRGRGGCYKHTFYGITSYQCMEATPSLACANKCVFCWRHHKNPVGKEWRWKTDDPKFIVDEAVNIHVRMIKETKGIPGVLPERWREAHTVRHCALSLVGEPIMYPNIRELLGELHNRHISTFLVTNGQHPQAIETLCPITQLYVSVDAPTPESLEAIDRPLFKDAWQRLQKSLVALKTKGQRTVARLTVVKGWNSDEVVGYAKLIALGHCSLVEVKGVTFCGKSDASNLNMTNTPWHHEVVELTKNLQKELMKMREEESDSKIPEYGLACEHKHSCSVLLARVDQFAVDDPKTGRRKWKTWIDYDKFQELAARQKDDPTFTFNVSDYVEDTPSWAIFGAEEEGFDPTDKRFRKKKKHPKYTKYDVSGIPTHDHDGKPLTEKERNRLRGLMDAKRAEIGEDISIMEEKRGEKTIYDASLMFRGLVIEKE